MDRGRCGLDLESNKFLRDQKLTRKRNDHLARLNKIKTRKAGTSSTLDNTAPECMFCERFKSDPRKVSKKKELNNTIERENKVLLQRISHILTAPPKITDSSYIAMKKLLSTLGDANNFNLELKKKYNEQFFSRVRKTEPYYNHKAWEQDYETQRRGQKFMRQVNYERPPNWVDPFQGKPPGEDYDQARSRRRNERERGRTAGSQSQSQPEDEEGPDAFARSTGDLAGLEEKEQGGKGGKDGKAGRGGGHVNKVKKLRASKSNPHPKTKEAFGKEPKGVSTVSDKDEQAGAAQTQQQQQPPPFASRMLAQTERTILMHTPGSIRAMQSATSQQEHSGRGGGEGEGSSSGRGTEERERERKGAVKEQPSEVTACVICSIVEDAYLYITIDSVATAATEEGGEGETSTEVTDTLHAEALVHISSLFLSESECAEGKTQLNFPLDDEGAQQLLAADIIDNVSLLKTPKNDFQVMLPWCSPSSGGGGGGSSTNPRRRSSNSTSGQGMDQTSVMNALDELDPLDQNLDQQAFSSDQQQQQFDSSRRPRSGSTAAGTGHIDTLERDQDDLNAYFTPIAVSCGVQAVLSSGVEPDDVNSRMKLRRKKAALGIIEFTPEDVYLLVKVSRVGEERARVVVHTLRDSVNLYKKSPAVPANTRLELMIALPSVLTVESELMEAYFKNAATNIRIEHSQVDGVNSLIFD